MLTQLTNWRLSFFSRVIVLRFILIPLVAIRIKYCIGGYNLTYTDINIFGIRVARISRKD
ncbi:hypothetical protein LCGC14_1092700 [marine sediment metagenome]|uniref:Uncharacterized protein n=1 Tax=marine sediment metagenome TaxID=412755 RepID=A0A0F9QHX5_9ZZZZ